MGLFSRLLGTASSFFRIGGPNGPGLANDGGSGNVGAYNAAQSAYVNVRGAILPASVNDLTAYANDLLANDPVTTCTYAITYTGTRVSSETWKSTGSGTPTIKSVAYTYTGNNVTQEVRTVYAANGTSIVAQLTVVYTYTGSQLTSATYTRNV